jgi:hypothetical protein
MEGSEMSNLYGAPSIDGSYQFSVHLVLEAYLSVIQFRDNCILNRYKMYLYLKQSENDFLDITPSETRIACGGHVC